MIRFLTAGESHGKGLTTIVEGFPSNISITKKYIDFHMSRRQAGYGRGKRMQIENDTVEILSGIRNNKTFGAPISIFIANKDFNNWKEILSVDSACRNIPKVTVPRPGHADLVGVEKYNLDDIRDVIERASARETATRVAACSIARKMLEKFGIHIGSYVESIGGIYERNGLSRQLFNNQKTYDAWEIAKKSDKSVVRVLNKDHERRIIRKIEEAKKKGNTLGGTFYVIATGVPVGLGSYVQYDRKLDAGIANSIMSINAVKGVEIGKGFHSADLLGSEVNDEIILKKMILTRKSNRAGGIEGGISTGLPIIVRVAMKPISTLLKPIETVNLSTMRKVKSLYERSDFVAVPSCAVVAESMLAWVLAEQFLLKFGGDSIDEIQKRFKGYRKNLYSMIKTSFTR